MPHKLSRTDKLTEKTEYNIPGSGHNKRNTLCQLVQYEKFIALTHDWTQPVASSWIVAGVQYISDTAIFRIKYSYT